MWVTCPLIVLQRFADTGISHDIGANKGCALCMGESRQVVMAAAQHLACVLCAVPTPHSSLTSPCRVCIGVSERRRVKTIVSTYISTECMGKKGPKNLIAHHA